MQENWKQIQDRRINATFDIFESMDAKALFERMWHHSANVVFYNSHLANLNLIKKKGDAFRLLDLGCGDGILAEMVADYFPKSEVVGVDGNQKSIELAQSRATTPNLTYHQIEISEGIDFGLFDIIVCSEVYEHVEDTDGLLDTIFGSLKPGGYLSLSTPSGWMYRVPSLSNVKSILTDFRNWYRLKLYPEKNWKEALTIHPAVFPRTLIRRFGQKGFRLCQRLSSVVNLSMNKKAPFYLFLRIIHAFNEAQAGKWAYYSSLFFEGMMNLFPPFRIFETRFILLLQKTDEDRK